jgi:hypothetical protein
MKRQEPFNVLRNPNSWSNAPRAETIAFAILAATGITATGTAIAVTTALVSVGLSLVTSWAVSALTPAPPTPKQSLLVNAREAAAPQEFIYGEVRKGGVVTYLESTNGNDVLHQIITLAGHEVEEIVDVYANDEILTLSNDAYSFNGREGAGWVTTSKWGDSDDGPEMRILYHTGSQTSINSTFANSSSATLNNTLGAVTANSIGNLVGNGVAYLYVQYVYNQSVYANGLPLITAKVRGKKVYDPRTTSTAYSNNAALCVRDYLTSAYGLDDDEIDDTVFSAAANTCDESVSLAGGGTEDRYTINGVVKADQSHGDVLQEMTTACAGTLFWGAGKWKLQVGEYNAPTKTLTLDDLRSPITLTTRTNLRDQFNIVQGVFTDAENGFIAADYPPLKGTTFISQDGGVEQPLNLDLPFTTSSATAQRLAKLTLFRGREQMTFSADFGLNAFDVEVGEIVALTIDRYGWTEKEFEVVGWRFGANDEAGDLRITLTLRETSEEAFDWLAEESAIIANDSDLLSYDFVPNVSIPSDQIVSEVRIIREKVTDVIEIAVTTGNSDFVDYVEVQYKATGATDWKHLGTGQIGIFELIDPEPGSYQFRARPVNNFGYKGTWVETASIPTAGSAIPPSDVSGLFYEVNAGSTTLEWEPITDLDLSYYRIRHSIATSGATWANSTTAVDKVPRPGTSVSLPTRSGTYLIKAYDKTGLSSENVDTVVIPSNEVPSYTTTLTQTDSTTFSGTKTGCSVTSSTLRITDPSTGPSEATYDFSTYIETSDSTARLVRARVDAGVQRIDNSAGLFDDLPGLFDELPGLFDDFTGSAQFADTNLLFYISTTEDDPAGTPTWSAYKQFRAGEFYGRAFRFRVVLKSTSDNVTPAITSLSAIVEYN